jgi:antitoxin component HigA of HigAB toxin-antitoxin module
MSNKALSIIKSEEQYEEYMNEIMSLLDSGVTPGTDAFDRFELINLLVRHYEEKQFPINKPSPIDAIKFRMEQQGLSQFDMRELIGSASKVSEILSGKRPLSLSMIRRIHDGLGIPLDVLIQDTSALEWEPTPIAWESFNIKTEHRNITKAICSNPLDFKPVNIANTVIDIGLDFKNKPSRHLSDSTGSGVIETKWNLASSSLANLVVGVVYDESTNHWVNV